MKFLLDSVCRTTSFLFILSTALPFVRANETYQFVQVTTTGSAYGVSNSGHVTGGTEQADAFWDTAYIWQDDDSDFIDGTDDFLFSYGVRVNSNGQVALNTYDFEVGHLAYYYDGEILRNLGTLPSKSSSFAADMNEAGFVVGYADNFDSEAFLWHPGLQSMFPLGKLGPSSGIDSRATGINNDGVVVGYSETVPFTGGTKQPFVWDATSGIQQLDIFRDGSNGEAKDINDRNQVIGTVSYNPYAGGGGPQPVSGVLSTSGIPNSQGFIPYNGLPDGIDISNHQREANWGEVWKAEIDFAYLKSTESDDFKDKSFDRLLKEGFSAGMMLGAYHFARPDLTSAVDEANYFADIIEPHFYNGLTLRPALDLEVEPTATLTFEALSTWTQTFMETFINRTGVEPLLYINSNFANNLDPTLADDYDLWLAHYTDAGNENTGAWDNWMIWQYSESGYVPGISDDGKFQDNVDTDQFNSLVYEFEDLLLPGAFPTYGPSAFLHDLDTGKTTYFGNPYERVEPTSINNLGEIVGFREDFETGYSTAFLYRNGEMIDLVELLPEGHGWRLDHAWDINDDGWIVAQGWKDGEQGSLLIAPDILTFTSSRDPAETLFSGSSSSSDPTEPIQAMTLELEDIEGGSAETVGNVTFHIIQQLIDNVVQRTFSLFMLESSPAYTWIPIQITNDVDFLSLELIANGLSEGDSIVVGLGDESLWTLTGSETPLGQVVFSGLLDISHFQGMTSELFIGLLSDDVPGASLQVQNFQLYSAVPEPSGILILLYGLILATLRRNRFVRRRDY